MTPARGRTATLAAGPALLLACAGGAASLSFEILWVRLLSLEVGGPLAAFTIVVSAFTSGLALGAAVLGRVADRVTRPIRVFAIAQMALGIAGIASAQAWSAGGATRMALRLLDAAPEEPSFLVVQTLTAGLAVFASATLAGGTLPLLLTAAGAGAGPASRPGLLCGSIAASNAAGASAGALACGFILLPAQGLTGSLYATSALAFLTGAAALAADRGVIARPAAPAPRAREAPVRGAGRLSLPLVALFVTGIALTSMEVAWARLAYLSFGSSAQAGSLVLAAVIAGLSAGYALGARVADRRSDAGHLLSPLLAGAALATVVVDPLLARLPVLAVRIHGLLVSEGASGSDFTAAQAARFLLLILLLGLPCLLLGAAFPIGFGAHLGRQGARPGHEGRAAGTASAATSAGHLLGAPLSYVLMVGQAGARGCLLAAAALLGFAALATGKGARRLVAVASVLATAIAGAFTTWDPALMSSGPFLYGALYAPTGGGATLEEIIHARGEVLFAREGPAASVTVRRSPRGILSMQVNGKTDASTGGDMKTQALMTQLPLLVYESSRGAPAEHVLVVGLGSGVSVASALTHAVRSVDVFEISPEVVDAARLFEAANHGATSDPRTRLTIGDARSRLLFGGQGARQRPPWDVIASQPSNPWVAGQSMLFTREFFEAARARLAPDGLMCQWVQGYGLDPEDFRSVAATFADVFDHVSLWEESTAGGDYLLLGSPAPLEIDPARLAQAMERARVAADLAGIEIRAPGDLLTHFVTGGQPLRDFVRGASLQVEDRLALEFTALPALYRETLGGIVAGLEPYRLAPSSLVPSDPVLSEALDRHSIETARERSWAAGLGLLEVSEADPDLLAAVSYLRAGMARHCIASLRTLLLRKPSERRAHLILGHLLMAEGRPAEAAEALRAAVDLDPAEAAPQVALSRALFAAGRPAEALARNAVASALTPGRAELASDRCAMLIALEDLASAEAACLEAIDRDASLAEAHANVGVVRMRRGRPGEAEAAYREALRLDPGLDDARYNLASLMERGGRAREAILVLLPLVDPGTTADAPALRLAARLALATGDRNRARAWAAASLAIEPEDEEGAALLAAAGR